MQVIMEQKEAHTIRVHEADPPMPGMERYRYLVSVDDKIKPGDDVSKPGWVGLTKEEAISDARILATQSHYWATIWRDRGSHTDLSVIKAYTHPIGL